MTKQNTSTDPTSKLERTEQYLVSDPSNPDLLAMAIDQNLALGRAGRAAQVAQAALALYPDDPYFRARGGNVLLAQEKWSEAEAVFGPLLTGDADASLAYNLAYAMVRQGRHGEAVAAMAPYAGAPGLLPAAATLLVRAWHHLGEFDTAFALIDAQMALCQDEPDFLAASSLLYFDADRLEEAEALSERAAGFGSAPLEALVVRGSLALARTDGGAAELAFGQALAVNPQEGRSWLGLGMASLMKRDLPAAREQLGKATRYMPGHIGSWHALGWCEIFAGDTAGAQETFRHALALDRNFSESHGGLAVAQATLGARGPAELSIERALRLDPASLSARYAQMVLSGETGDPVRFRALAMRLLSSRAGPFGKNMAEIVGNYENK